ncbi:MAG: ferrous iron transporter B, partial [Chitinophagaceae bacterium]
SDLGRELGVPVIAVNPRKQKGIAQLKKAIEQTASNLYKIPSRDFIDNKALAPLSVQEVQDLMPGVSDYSAIHYLINHESFDLNDALQRSLESIEEKNAFNHTKTQATEILQRYTRIKHVMGVAVSQPDPMQQTLLTDKLDNVLLHRHWGYAIL